VYRDGQNLAIGECLWVIDSNDSDVVSQTLEE